MTKFKALAVSIALVFLMVIPPGVCAQKPPVTFDEFFDSVDFRSVQVSPDGGAVVIATERADWENNRWRDDLWLYRVEGAMGGSLIALTQSGDDSDPQWSPNGRWIAFLSDRPVPRPEGDDDNDPPKDIAQVYVISASGGEAFPVTWGDEEVHAFAWSADSQTIYFSTREVWTKEKNDEYKKSWKDVIRHRESERGDTIRSLDLASVMARPTAGGKPESSNPFKTVATIPFRVSELAVSPDGRRLALATIPPSERQESMQPYAIYLVDLPAGEPHLLSRTMAVYENLRWSPDSRHIFFWVELGTVEGPYLDLQPRIYWADAQTGRLERWGARFSGALTSFDVQPSGSLFAAGRLGTRIAAYSQENHAAELAPQPGWPGTYERLSSAQNSPRVAFVFSTLQKPAEVYLAESPGKLDEARPITSFNRLFAERALPHGKPYRWTSDDGTPVEGMLIYPPGKFDAKRLPMFTFIHGGPGDADGDHFEADWYQWAALAATDGWLVFEPNYRGSIGYGDKFALEVAPHLVSRPGKDILAGVDALVKDGIADPDRLAIGGYSYGGYLTNWLITQTTRFKAAVTGAGSIEHAADWGNDDVNYDYVFMIGGMPWEAKQTYNDEAALWQINNVKTPTHIVAGGEDVRVPTLEAYLLERALFTLGVPSTLLIFPGEGHSLDKNPWHGKIKVREELKWLQKYGGR